MSTTQIKDLSKYPVMAFYLHAGVQVIGSVIKEQKTILDIHAPCLLAFDTQGVSCTPMIEPALSDNQLTRFKRDDMIFDPVLVKEDVRAMYLDLVRKIADWDNMNPSNSPNLEETKPNE